MDIVNKKVKVKFSLPAHIVGQSTQAKLLGEFNQWNIDEAPLLSRDDQGNIVGEIELLSGQSYQYKYLLNDGRWVNDGGSKVITEIFGNIVENSVVNVEKEIEEKVSNIKPTKRVVKKSPAKSTKAIIKSDDFTKIVGISKPVEKLLKAAGITTYGKLAKTSIVKLRTLLDGEGTKYKTRNPAHWPNQAKLCNAASWEELEKYQREMKK